MKLSRRSFSLAALAAASYSTQGVMAHNSNPDVVVIGAGAAGLAATATLLENGKSVTCIEAASRIGGRVHTNTDIFGIPFDMGAHWLHNADLNPFIDIGKNLGLDLYQAPDRVEIYDRDGPAGLIKSAKLWREYNRINGNFEAASADALDVSGASLLEPQNSLTTTVAMAIGSLSMARDMVNVSVADLNAAASGDDWFCRQGFGCLVRDRWRNVPISLKTVATKIKRVTGGVEVHTNEGTITAKSVIVTVSQGVLASGTLTFEPRLPDATSRAIEQINMGSYNHVAVQLKPKALDLKPDTWVVYEVNERVDSSPKGGGILANFGGTDLSLFEVGGEFSRSLEKAGTDAASAFAIDEMVRLFGSDIRDAVVKTYATRWGADPYVLGSYSGAQPGSAHLRAVLQDPIEGRIFLAGEATHLIEMATVAGAHKEGIRVANVVTSIL
jgi:monoamine oxidase